MKNVAVLGLGGISKRVIQGVIEAENAVLYAVAARDINRAVQFKEVYHAQVAYGDYETMLEDPEVDVVYIATANKFHYDQIMMCIKHHKHVICEKPMVATIDEVNEIFDAASKAGVFLMEAEKTLFTPLNRKITELIQQGEIGELVSMEAAYANATYYEESHDHWVFDKDFGGAMFDIGVYPICYINYFAASKIKQMMVSRVYGEEGCDVYARGLIHYENGRIGSFYTGWIAENDNFGILYGTKGSIKTKQFWKHRSAEITYDDGTKKIIEVAACSDFKGEVEHAITCIEECLLESPILGREASLEILKVVLCENC